MRSKATDVYLSPEFFFSIRMRSIGEVTTLMQEERGGEMRDREREWLDKIDEHRVCEREDEREGERERVRERQRWKQEGTK